MNLLAHFYRPLLVLEGAFVVEGALVLAEGDLVLAEEGDLVLVPDGTLGALLPIVLVFLRARSSSMLPLLALEGAFVVEGALVLAEGDLVLVPDGTLGALLPIVLVFLRARSSMLPLLALEGAFVVEGALVLAEGDLVLVPDGTLGALLVLVPLPRARDSWMPPISSSSTYKIKTTT
jgi:predicted methyltransferase MtxX (methanogen marker protein 4)